MEAPVFINSKSTSNFSVDYKIPSLLLFHALYRLCNMTTSYDAWMMARPVMISLTSQCMEFR